MTAPAYPNLHRIAYGEGARLTAEARVEAADALERLAAYVHASQNLPLPVLEAVVRSWRNAVITYVPGAEDECPALKEYAASLTSAHDKEKS